MKNILFLLLISVPALAQEYLAIFPMAGNEIVYTGVINADSSMTKQILFANGEKWFVHEYKSAQDVIQYKNEGTGELIGKGFFKESCHLGMTAFLDVSVYHTVKLSFKDGRFKYVVTDITFKWTVPPSTYSRGKNYEGNVHDFVRAYGDRKKIHEFLFEVDAKIKAIIASLSNYIPSQRTVSEEKW